MTPDELAAIHGWAARATPGPWEPGVAYLEAPVNPGAGGWGDWRADADRFEPDLLLAVQHLPVGQCYLCEDGPPVSATERDTPVRVFRRWDSGHGADEVGAGMRRITYHLHRAARGVDHPHSPISSTSACRAVVDARTEDDGAHLVLLPEDAEFIARARAAVPALLAEVDRLSEALRAQEDPMSKRGGNKPKRPAKPPMPNKGPKAK